MRFYLTRVTFIKARYATRLCALSTFNTKYATSASLFTKWTCCHRERIAATGESEDKWSGTAQANEVQLGNC